MMEWIYYMDKALEFLDKLNLEQIVIIIGLVVILMFLWPIGQSYLKVYDITLINRLDHSCKHTLLKASCGATHIKGADDMDIDSLHAVHIQLNPKLRGMIGSYTHHIRVKNKDGRSVIIPIYNSGDIKRSRIFFIEPSGVRESASTDIDIWNWCDSHAFGESS